ncbi:PTS sugar transporter, putative [Babesia caballi]|uniref:PTS sugar transporter, putative n=1 Tax=Babesia caballi TaxID=5871 RepID=A0AAV4LM64_BABCB|nr:PTS sugar transporter, putative [Babesia caballi]
MPVESRSCASQCGSTCSSGKHRLLHERGDGAQEGELAVGELQQEGAGAEGGDVAQLEAGEGEHGLLVGGGGGADELRGRKRLDHLLLSHGPADDVHRLERSEDLLVELGVRGLLGDVDDGASELGGGRRALALARSGLGLLLALAEIVQVFVEELDLPKEVVEGEVGGVPVETPVNGRHGRPELANQRSGVPKYLHPNVLADVRNDGIGDEAEGLVVEAQSGVVHVALGHLQVVAARSDVVVEAVLEGVAVDEGGVGLLGALGEDAQLVLEDALGVLRQAAAAADAAAELHLQHSRLGGLLGEVGVVEAVAGVGEGHASAVRGVLSNGVLEGEEVALGLGHLLGVNQDVADAEVGAGHGVNGLYAAPDGVVDEETHGQVVEDEVLAGGAEVDGVPVGEVAAHGGELVANRGVQAVGRRVAEVEDVVEDLRSQLVRLEVEGAGGGAEDVALEVVGDGVVGHVDGAVRKALDQGVLVLLYVLPGQDGAQTVGAAAGPVVEPADHVLDLVEGGLRVAGEPRGVADVPEDALLPGFVAELGVPLVAEGHDADVAGASHDALRGLVVDEGLLAADHFLANEAALVEDFLAALQLHAVLVGGDLLLLAEELGGAGAEAGDLDYGNGVEAAVDGVDVVLFFVVGGLLVDLEEGDVVVGRVAGHARDDASALLHRDGGHGQDVDAWVDAEGAAERGADELLAAAAGHCVQLAERGRGAGGAEENEALVGHVHGGPRRGDVQAVAALHGLLDAHDGLHHAAVVEIQLGGAEPEDHVVGPLGEHEAVGLAVHGLGAEGGGEQKELLGGQHVLEGLVDGAQRAQGVKGRVLDAHLNHGVLLGGGAFPLGAVVVGAGLHHRAAKDRGAATEVQRAQLLHARELPLDELVVVRVAVGGDEGAAPVHRGAEALQVLDGQRGEVGEPVLRVGELGDFVVANAHVAHDVHLGHLEKVRRPKGDCTLTFDLAVSLLFLEVYLVTSLSWAWPCDSAVAFSSGVASAGVDSTGALT